LIPARAVRHFATPELLQIPAFQGVQLFERSRFDIGEKRPVDRILKPITYVLAVLYILIDAIFMTVAKPIGDWIAKRLALRKLCAWIRSLRPYPSLALFSVPVIILEPVKPAAAYLAATGQFAKSAFMLITGELLKLVLIERLFSLTRDKLMKIPAFAWLFAKFCEAKAWLESTEAWRTMRRLRKVARDCVSGMKASGVMHRYRTNALKENGGPQEGERAWPA
jgi:hypothetical protein